MISAKQFRGDRIPIAPKLLSKQDVNSMVFKSLMTDED